jgi:hypothetical protein
MNQMCYPFERQVSYQIFVVGKEFEKFLIEIKHLGDGFASIEAFVPVCAVCTSTHKHSVPQSLLSIKKRFEAVCREALFAKSRIFYQRKWRQF